MCKRGQTCKIRAISECSPLLAAGSQKRCVKGPQRWLEAFVPLQSGPAISAAVGEVSVGLIWWPSHPSINEDNGVQARQPSNARGLRAGAMGLPTYQPTYQQQTFEHTSTKLSNPATKIPAANLCCCFSQAPNERLTQLSFWQPSWFCTLTSVTGEMMMSLAEKDPMLMMMMSPTEKEPTTESVIRLRTHRVGDVQR